MKVQYVVIADKLFTAAAATFVTLSKQQGLKVDLIPEVNLAACGNCGGCGQMIIRAYNPTPVKNIPEEGTSLAIGKEVYIGTHKVFPCPACNEFEIADAIRRCVSQNGLTVDEQNWRVAYLRGMEGKEDMLAYAISVLTSSPPVGFDCFFGDNGVGKSGTAKAIVANLSSIGVRAISTTMARILEEAEAGYSQDEDRNKVSVAGVIAKYNSAQFLFIDEFDRVGASGWRRELIFNLLNTRYDRRKEVATLLATNRDVENLGAELRFLESRLKDGRRINVGGVDLRGNK